MVLNLRMMKKNIVLWMPRRRRGKERNFIPNPSPVKMERSATCPK